jgi:hypothetical protein
MVKIASAQRAPNRRPRPDEPAWISTGRPWGVRGIFSGHAAVAVQLERALAPAVPEFQRDLDKFIRAVVAQVVFQVLVLAEQAPFAVVHRGHDIPGRTALGQVVERGEFAGDMRRFVVGRGAGRAQAQFGGLADQVGKDR